VLTTGADTWLQALDESINGRKGGGCTSQVKSDIYDCFVSFGLHLLWTKNTGAMSVVLCSNRTTAARYWTVGRDEHTLSVLVVLPAPALQPHDVWRVSATGRGRRCFRIQVEYEDMVWNAWTQFPRLLEGCWESWNLFLQF